MNPKNLIAAAIIGAWTVLAAGCGGSSSSGDSAAPPQASSHTIGGSVTGLLGTIVLANNGGDALTIDQNGAFVFANALASGSTYAITVQTQPADQACTVDNGSGTVANAAVTNIVINCAAPTRTVGGNVHGLHPSGQLVLQNNGGDALTLGADGPFVFASAVPAGSAYAVTVLAQPANQLCTVGHGTGMIGADHVTNVIVNCSTLTRTVGGSVSGLAPSESVVLQNNGDDDLVLSADGNFTFATPVAQSAPYAVTVLTQPSGQTCSVTNGSGTAGGVNIVDVQVTCSANAYSIGGTSSGLAGTVVLQNSGADDLALSSSGGFTFATLVAQGAPYNVTVLTQPVGQTCSITNGSGIMGAGNVTNVGVACSANATTLSISPTNIALSVAGLTEYGVIGTPSSGVARTITVTNTGSDNAIDVAVTAPAFPVGTTISASTCSGTLVAGGSCSITITPGATASSDGNDPCSAAGTAPQAGTIEVAGTNTNTVTSNAVILSYGCIYQGGHVYAFDDTTSTSGSVGGKVLATSAQALPGNGVIWASNGAGTNPIDVSTDLIPGISDISSSSGGDPSYADFSAYFATFYTNPNPFTAASFDQCDGAVDGQCNTNNIVAFYDQFVTNNTLNNAGSPPFTATPGPTPASSYAAGLCKQSINAYSDWYLPASCEMGYGAAACGTDAAPALQNAQSNLVDFNNLNLIGGGYWTSTQFAVDSTNAAWSQLFAPSTTGAQSGTLKETLLGVICSRALTY